MKAFMAVSAEASFSRAAQRLHLAQPAVTAQIQNLEKYLGVRLFERDNRGVRLTDAGAAFLEPCRAALHAVEAAALQAQNGGTGEHGRIRIGFNVGFSIDPLVPLTRAVRTRYPHLEFQVGAPALGRGLAQLLLGVAQLCVVVPEDHRLAGLPEVSAVELRDDPFVLAT